MTGQRKHRTRAGDVFAIPIDECRSCAGQVLPEPLAARLLRAPHQPGVGGELLHAVGTADVVDLVEDRERQHLPTPGIERRRVRPCVRLRHARARPYAALGLPAA